MTYQVTRSNKHQTSSGRFHYFYPDPWGDDQTTTSTGSPFFGKEPGGLPLAQLAFEAAKAGAKALLCGPKSGLSGQQLPAGGGQRGWKGGKVNVPKRWE